MTKAEIIERVYEGVEGINKKQAAEYVETMLNLMKGTLVSGEMVKISGFGNFVVRQKHPRQGRNPQTGEPLAIQGRRVVNFKVSAILKEALNGDSHSK